MDTYQPRQLPNKEICRTKYIGIEQFSECLVGEPIGCNFAQSFGYGFFCRHPERKNHFQVPEKEIVFPPVEL
jgi:hypothetical protein